MEQIYDMVIIGGGPAGYTAALYGARAGLNVLVVERLSAGGQMALTGDIENYPGFEDGIDGFTLGMKMQTAAERFGAKTEYAEVLSVDFSKKIKEIFSTNGKISAKTVLIATGANPRELGLKNETDLVGRGIHYCAHCDGRFYKEKSVIVVGGGNSAIQDALYLSKIAKKVYLVHRRNEFRATKIYLEPLLKCVNVEFVFDSVVREFLADDRIIGAKVENIKTGETTEISCDGIFISIGRKPATQFLEDSVDIDDFGYIIANESTKTNIDGIYAIGDVRTKALRQIVTAVADGAVAVHHAEEYISKFDI